MLAKSAALLAAFWLGRTEGFNEHANRVSVDSSITRMQRNSGSEESKLPEFNVDWVTAKAYKTTTVDALERMAKELDDKIEAEIAMESLDDGDANATSCEESVPSTYSPSKAAAELRPTGQETAKHYATVKVDDLAERARQLEAKLEAAMAMESFDDVGDAEEGQPQDLRGDSDDAFMAGWTQEQGDGDSNKASNAGGGNSDDAFMDAWAQHQDEEEDAAALHAGGPEEMLLTRLKWLGEVAVGGPLGPVVHDLLGVTKTWRSAIVFFSLAFFLHWLT